MPGCRNEKPSTDQELSTQPDDYDCPIMFFIITRIMSMFMPFDDIIFMQTGIISVIIRLFAFRRPGIGWIRARLRRVEPFQQIRHFQQPAVKAAVAEDIGRRPLNSFFL